MVSRKTLPPSLEAEVLTSSRRRCAICYGLSHDDGLKHGQIAHLDSDASNNNLANLVFLCFAHHDEYDSSTSQSKGLTAAEVCTYRSLLYEHNNVELSTSCELVLEIDRDYDQYTPTEMTSLVRAITALSGIGDGVRVVRKQRGSVLVTLAMTLAQAQALLDAIERGELRTYGVVRAQLSDQGDAPPIEDGYRRAAPTSTRKTRPARSQRGERKTQSGWSGKPFSGGGKKLYVGNLSWQTTDEELRELFAPFGEVSSVRVVHDRDTGRSRGFGFVEMSSGVEAAIQGLDGADLNGRSLRVTEATLPEGHGSRPHDRRR